MKKNRRLATALTAFALIALPGIIGSGTAYANATSCLLCHNAMSGKATTASGAEIELRINTQVFQASVHGSMACTECHQAFTENPHTAPDQAVADDLKKLSSTIGKKAKVDPVAYSACSTCHSDVYQSVLTSVHGKNIAEKGAADGALCLDCHGGPHGIVKSSDENSPVNRKHVVATCASCHADEKLAAKYGHETNIMESYNESFHGKKYTLGHTKAPTCVNCHGYHDIKSKSDPASPVFGTANKTKTCGNCHKGANATFVGAITHKPAGPIPHYAELGLIVLTMGTIAFTIAHVLLEAYSDIRDVVFRRKEEEEETKNESYNECA